MISAKEARQLAMKSVSVRQSELIEKDIKAAAMDGECEVKVFIGRNKGRYAKTIAVALEELGYKAIKFEDEMFNTYLKILWYD